MLPHFLNYYHSLVSGCCLWALARYGRASSALPHRARRQCAPPPPPRPPPPQGITWRRFLVLLHHTPGAYSRKGLEDAMGICSGYAVECRWVLRRGVAVRCGAAPAPARTRRRHPPR